MLPSDKYADIITLTRACAAACGADVADPNYRMNFITYCVVSSITVYFLCSAYTVQLTLSEDWGALLEVFCMVGSVFQGCSKLASGIILRRYLLEINGTLNSIYQTYERKGEEYLKVLYKSAVTSALMLRTAMAIYVLCVGSLMASPWVIYLTTGRRYMAMQFILPGLNPETNVGYYVTIAMQSACLFFGGFGNFADILKLKVSELNELTNKCTDDKESYRYLMTILEWHQQFSHFTDAVNALTSWVIGVQITAAAISIVFTLYITFFGDWPGSYPYLVLQVSMLYVYCGLGTLVEITTDKCCDIIYEIVWYNLPIAQQKIILLMLMKSQDPSLIKIAGLVPLSVNAGLQVTKSIYSIMMMLLNFVE